MNSGAAFEANATGTANTSPSAGALLRAAREHAGVHIGALAGALKVPVGKLEALEADRLDLLPDFVFARALAASVCRTLKVDPEPVLRLLPEHNTPRLRIDARVSNATFHTTGTGWRVPVLSKLPKSVAAIAALLLVGTAVLLFAPSLESLRPTSTEPAAGSSAASGTAVEPVVASAVQALSTPPTPPVVPPTTDAAVAPMAAISQPLAGSSVPVASAEAQPVASDLLVFKARADSWVQVVDANGVVVLRKTLLRGESAQASGPPPLSVVIGRADTTEVLVRGKAFDIAASSKDNVARFQVR
jgi:cytoskeleton protein RodZ